MAKVDLSGLHARIADMHRVGHEADDAAAAALAGVFVETVAELTPKDTNRAANGWILAGRSAGVTDMAALPYKPSAKREEYLRKMEVEMDGLADRIRRDESMMAKYEREDAERAATPRRDGRPRKRRVNQPYYKTMQKRARRNRRSLERLTEQYKKAVGSEFFLFFDADSIVQRKQGRRFSTVRAEPYGGVGVIHKDARGIQIELRNREPHVNIIEKHPHLGHPIATAQAITRSAGLALASQKYLEVSRRRLRAAS